MDASSWPAAPPVKNLTRVGKWAEIGPALPVSREGHRDLRDRSGRKGSTPSSEDRRKTKVPERGKVLSLLKKRAPRPFWKILYMVGVLMAAAASSPAQGRLVLRSELITESHFCHFRQNHNTIKI